MVKLGDMLTLAALMDRSQSDEAFVTVQIIDGLITAIYGNPTSGLQEYWQALPDTNQLILKRFFTPADSKNE